MQPLGRITGLALPEHVYQRETEEPRSPLSILAHKLGVNEHVLDSFRLSLESSNLTSLPPEIGNLSQLQKLWLDNNQLTSLPPDIGNLSQLEELSLSANQLTSLPPEIGNLTKLKDLWLNKNKLTSLPPEIGNLSQVQRLSLDYNRLTSLPYEIGNLSQLEQLSLDYNQLTSLPSEIGNLSQLKYIWLNKNELTSLPPEIGNLSQLKQLLLDSNRFISLPPEIGNLSKLDYLNLSNNLFTDIPECLFRLPQTCIIDIENNPIPIERLRALETRVNTPGYNGPRFKFSSTAKTADEVIQEWGGDPSKLQDKESLKTWLQRQEDTKDYKDRRDQFKEEIKDVLVWMGSLKDQDTMEQAKLLISQGSATCGDRLTQSRNDLACLKKVAESSNLSLNDLKDLIIGLHRLNLFRKRAKSKLESMNANDEIKTLLHFENALKAPLNLLISTSGMLYQGMSGVTPQDIESAKTAILSKTTSLEDQTEILIQNIVWQKRLDTHPDMPALKKSINQAKENFEVAASDREAEYVAEFNRLTTYLTLTKKLLETPNSKT